MHITEMYYTIFKRLFNILRLFNKNKCQPEKQLKEKWYKNLTFKLSNGVSMNLYS